MEMRDAFIEALFPFIQRDRRIIFISNEYGAPSLDRLRVELSPQFINAGISEQNLISVAAGLAMTGKQVVVYSIASFITLRCLEQIKLDLCVMHLPVVIVGVGPCYAYGVDGPSHHASEDLALMRSLAHMTIYSPSDAQMASNLVSRCLSGRSDGPIYCRLDKGAYPATPPPDEKTWQAGFRLMQEGGDVCLVATGSMVHRTLEAASALLDLGLRATVVDLFCIKPLQKKQLSKVLRGCKGVIAVDEHTIHGGIGSLVAEVMAEESLMLPFRRIAIRDAQLYAYGQRERLQAERGLDVAGIVDATLTLNAN